LRCHTASGRWDVAPPIIAFFKKTTRQLCYHFSVNLQPGEETAIHLENDDLIGLAFAGRRGNAVKPEFTEKPPMTRAQFVAAYRNWVKLTGGGCSSWEGTITRTETIAGTYRDDQQIGPMTMTSSQNGAHTITLKISGGKAVVTTTLSGDVHT